MVIEYLTFSIEPGEAEDWLRAEEQHWSRFLERQPGFVSKQMWRSIDDDSQLHAVIWWESLEHWKAVPEDELDRVAAAMGSYERTPVMTAFELVRDC